MRHVWKSFEYTLFIHAFHWVSECPCIRGWFRHLLHLMLLTKVVIFWLNDAWKWTSIFSDQKYYVMAISYMHYKHPCCLLKWKYHIEFCIAHREMQSFRLSWCLGQDTVQWNHCNVLLSKSSAPDHPEQCFTRPKEAYCVATLGLTLKSHTYN